MIKSKNKKGKNKKNCANVPNTSRSLADWEYSIDCKIFASME